MSLLKQRLAGLVPGLRDDIKQLVSQHGAVVIDQVTVEQAYGGMRGVLAVVCDTSLVTPETGLIIRGRPILDLVDKAPEEIFWLLLTGDLPDATQLAGLRSELAEAGDVPGYVWDVLDSFPPHSHPM